MNQSNSPVRPKPNLIFIMPDQLRADFLRPYGCEAIPTPNLDALCEQATVYDSAYSMCPLCVPARAALITGLNPLHSGVLSNHQWLRPDRHQMGLRTWPELLREAGYWTAAYGKMHFHPFESAEGFDERVIAEDKRWVGVHDDYAEHLAEHGLTKFDATAHPDYAANMGAVAFPYDVEFTGDRFVSRQAADFIRRQPGDRPFALMIGFPSPHCPYDALPEYAAQVNEAALPSLLDSPDVPKQFWHEYMDRFITNHKRDWHGIDYSNFTREARQRIRVQYAGLICQLDEEIGRVMDACREKGIWDNTLFVVTSDHGDHVGDRGLVGKGDFFEESIHIPLIAKMPGQQKAERCQALVELQQVPPTLLQMAGISLPRWWDYQPLPGAGEPADPDTFYFGILNDTCMVRKGPWKLSDYQVGAFSYLVNLDEDPQEEHNRLNDPTCTAIRIELSDALRGWMHRNSFRGHTEKHLTIKGGLARDKGFGRVGWQWGYPLSVYGEGSVRA
ncbi:MAG: sulfatase-like hydrolase/transferase [Verrucomicrobiota bacterium JB024]|nr:sulfatase-like hydrolase/transferase [Verrucomicrobiota bacterium JB024]